jgi:drug/metabolite transporter (DMT)-like permease
MHNPATGPRKAPALTNTTGVLGTVIAALTIDRFGPRKVLFVGAALLGATVFLTGGFDRLLVDNQANRLNMVQ